MNDLLILLAAGGEKIAFSQSVYLSEKSVAHRNFALAHFMVCLILFLL